MRRRRHRPQKNPSQSYESFLDTLTNTLGVLMFVTIFTTLIAEKGDSIVRTPLAAETKKTPRFFEIRNNRVNYINDEKIGKEIEDLTSNLPPCNRPNLPSNNNPGISQEYTTNFSDYRACLTNRASRLVNFRSETDYYNVRMYNASTFSLIYEPIPNKPGESKADFKLPESDFKQILTKLDPNKDYLAFIVRPDSFSTFRAAREEAWTKGFNVGWEPHPKELPIIFGAGGRSIDAQ
jgi:hypothetical protein